MTKVRVFRNFNTEAFKLPNQGISVTEFCRIDRCVGLNGAIGLKNRLVAGGCGVLAVWTHKSSKDDLFAGH